MPESLPASPAGAQPHPPPSATCQLIADNYPAPPSTKPAAAAAPTAVLELQVRNHPGTMSHVTGLFARRGFNLDAVVCVPEDNGTASRMLLLVAEEPRLEQVERQLAKLYDVLTLRHRADLTAEWFAGLLRVTDGG